MTNILIGLEYIGIMKPALMCLLLIPFPLMMIIVLCTNNKTELIRKAIHVISGVIIVCALILLNNIEVICFLLLLTVAALLNALIYSYQETQFYRGSIGLVTFPIGILITYVLFSNISLKAVLCGVLVLAFADAAAAIIGSKWGKPWFNKKSLLGSLTFFIVTLVIISLYTNDHIILIQIASIVTVMELISKKGADNILIPLSVTALLITL